MTGKILLVEDEAILALAESKIIEQQGFRVTRVLNGEAALQAVMDEPDFDLILMDIDLGRGMDGTETARKILEHQTVPIVFLTSHSEKTMVEKVKGITRYGYVLKSAGEFVLMESINMALQLFEAHASLEKENKRHLETACQLTERNEFIETILDNLPIGLAVNYVDQGTATYMNRVFESTYGWPQQDLTDIDNFFKCVYPDPAYREQMLERIGADIASGDPERMIWEHIEITTSTGEKRFVSATNIPIPQQNFMISTVRDITESYRKSMQLEESERRYRAIVQTNMDGYWLVNLEGEILDVNESYLKMSGYSRDELLGHSIALVEAQENPVDVARHIQGIIEHGHDRFESVHRRKDGSVYEVEISASYLPGELGVFIVNTRDISERKQGEQKLLEAEWKFRALFENGPIGVAYHRMITDSEGNLVDYEFLDANRAFIELTGVDPRGKLLTEAFPGIENDPFDWIGTFGEVARTGTQIRFEQYLESNGCWYDCVAYQYKLDHFVAAFFNITDRKKAEAALQESEARFNLALEGTAAGLWDWDMIKDSVVFSPQWKRMLGYQDHEVENSFQGWKNLWHPDDGALIEQAINDYLEGISDSYEIIYRCRHKNGEWRWMLTRGAIVYNEAGAPVRWVGTNLDITQQKQTEAQLSAALEQQKFLMRELNHRVKNNLSIISSLIMMKNSNLKGEVDLSDIVHQVEAVQLVHEKLSSSEEVNKIAIRDYINDLLETIFDSFQMRRVAVESSIDDIDIPASAAIPLGLIVNEVATNSMKYGFPQGIEPRLMVELTATDGRCRLILGNGGPPMPEEADIAASTTLGMQLISALVQQLDGELELKKSPHPRYCIDFAVPRGEL